MEVTLKRKVPVKTRVYEKTINSGLEMLLNFASFGQINSVKEIPIKKGITMSSPKYFINGSNDFSVSYDIRVEINSSKRKFFRINETNLNNIESVIDYFANSKDNSCVTSEELLDSIPEPSQYASYEITNAQYI